MAGLLVAGAISSLQAETVTWTGAADSSWSNSANWSNGEVPGSSASAGVDVLINSNTGMAADNTIENIGGWDSDPRILNSITFDISGARLYQAGDPYFVLGDSETVGQFTLTSAFTTDGWVFFGGGTRTQNNYRRGRLQFDKGMLLTNNGTGVGIFERAYVQNTVDSANGSVTFAGSGSWLFATNSYLGKARNAPQTSSPYNPGSILTPDAVVNVKLGDNDNAFSGTVTYASSLAMEVTTLEINGGTLNLQDSGINNTGALTVGLNGSFIGTGDIAGAAIVAGQLSPGADGTGTGTFSFGDDLSLQSTAEVLLGITGTGAGTYDHIQLDGGILTYGGSLIVTVDGTYTVGDSWALFTGYGSESGDFDTISINGVTLTKEGDVWVGSASGVNYQFDQAAGELAVVVPEPGTIVFVGLAAVTFALALRRRGRRC
ncbi:PEP-CTERM sorting domain-containing protein [Ruficoccus amylovorans]|uniref:PEP-CTERM sorting domain-containing protein n=1 Tax=Ruficoccus amylovorans TaxID=1804625 RepID=A0A842H9R0_9BACT|nr:PEP-CTERM sorting domain-containing protein [Ruficoccus amylovorans]MBC2593025.1 PEP-CTERM sorting domain-containing protein [Ruficoccus amylovorans]